MHLSTLAASLCIGNKTESLTRSGEEIPKIAQHSALSEKSKYNDFLSSSTKSKPDQHHISKNNDTTRKLVSGSASKLNFQLYRGK